jgi:hypothetical protein
MFFTKSAWAGAVNVRVVAVLRLVLDVRNGDCHRLGFVANGAALGDVRIRLELGQAFVALDFKDCGCEGGLLPWSM